MKLAGITLIANGDELDYPYKVCIQNLLDCCDKVYVSLDTQDKGPTHSKVEALSKDIIKVFSKWNWDITMGQDLAVRANLALQFARQQECTHCLYVQADEIVNPVEINNIKPYISNANYALERTYFWQDLQHINLTWTHKLIRLAKLTEKVSVITDGMFLQPDLDYPTVAIHPSVARIYHYSRVGNTKNIATRLNKLDSLFHQENEFTPLTDYEFGKNNNFEEQADVAKVIKVNLKHPPGIKELYNG